MVISIRATNFNARLRKARLEHGCSDKMLKERKRRGLSNENA